MRTLALLAAPSTRPSTVVALALLGACGDPPQRFTEPMVLGGQDVSPEVLGRGARVYALYCVSCHGADGSGQGNASRSFTVPPRDFRAADFRYVSGPAGSLPTDEDLEQTIRRGVPDNGMPAWDGLPAEDRHAVIQYLKTFSERWATETPSSAEERRS